MTDEREIDLAEFLRDTRFAGCEHSTGFWPNACEPCIRDAIQSSSWLAAHTKAAVDAAVLAEREAAAVRVEALLELRGLDLSHELAIEGAARVVRDGGDS